jgi:hypothetical protein
MGARKSNELTLTNSLTSPSLFVVDFVVTYAQLYLSIVQFKAPDCGPCDVSKGSNKDAPTPHCVDTCAEV